MIDLWNSSDTWRLIINLIGTISIIVGVWVIFKLFKQFFLRKQKIKLESQDFVKLMNLPPIMNGTRQIGCILSTPQKVEVSVLDEFEKSVFPIHNGNLDVGEHIFKVDFNQMKNGHYYLSISTEKQNILRKITVKNEI